MCLTVYLASDDPLQTIAWQRAAPGFYVSDRLPDAKGVRRHLTKPYVYLLGTHTGCGCGFLSDGVPAEGPEYDEIRAMYRGVAAYLRANASGRTVKIYTCWGGDERADAEHRSEIDANEIERDGFAFQERQLLSVDVGR